jgi:hypothetical protein
MKSLAPTNSQLSMLQQQLNEKAQQKIARPGKAQSKTSRPPKPKFTIDHARQKRDEISQFLEKNCLSEISAILPPSDVAKSVVPRSVPDQSGLFNKTDIRIFQELFPDRAIKAQRLIELGINSKPVKSPRDERS